MIGDPLALRIHTPVGRATPEQVAAVVGGETTPAGAVEALLARAPAAEFEGE